MSNVLPTKVGEKNLTALIQRLGTDCHPLQFIREFTQNSIEAIQRTGKPGRLDIDVNWDYLDLEITPTYKLSFTDTGDGMTGDEMIQYINQLASSGGENVYENYGMGAKISAITRNKQGIMYDSWKDSEGSQILYHYDDESKVFGLEQYFDEETGEAEYYQPLDDGALPDLIREHNDGQHGTRVTLWGNASDQDTMQLPQGAQSGTKEAWIYQAVNSRYFEIPDGITIRIRIGYDRDRSNTKHNHMLIAKGQKATLDKFGVQSGLVDLSDAKVHWWILQEGRGGHGRDYVGGHIAVLNQNEMLNRNPSRSFAADFGITFGAKDIVLCIEPNGDYVQNTARTQLIKRDGNELPFDRWADEFRNRMPQEIKDFIEEKMNASTADSHDQSIRKRLKSIAKFYKLTRYAMNKNGKVRVDPNEITSQRTGVRRRGDSNPNPTHHVPSLGPNSGPNTQSLAVLRKAGGVRASEVRPDPFPEVKWVSSSDGSRERGDELEDRAAEYFGKANLIKANWDFQGFQDLVGYYMKQYQHVANAGPVITDILRELFEQQLVETVTGALSFRGRPKWNPEQYQSAISPETLTAAVMTRYYVMQEANRKIKQKLGAPDEAAA